MSAEAESNIPYAKAETAKSTEKTALRASPESSVAALRSPYWGCSSAGRAPALQAGGQGFDSPHLHQPVERVSEKVGVQRKRTVDRKRS